MDRRRFLAAAGAVPVFGALGKRPAFADDHLKWAVFVPDKELTYRMVMKPFAETVQKETDGGVVFDYPPKKEKPNNRQQTISNK